MSKEMNIKQSVAGFYKIEAVALDGSKRILADWFPNLITDNGLINIGASSDFMTYCSVGTGNTTPSFGDSTLDSYVASTKTHQSSVNTVSSSSPYHAKLVQVYEFATGDAAGVLAEVGVGPLSDGSNLTSRALILDADGNPTTVTILADETLYVTYDFRCYAPTADVTGTIILNGVSTDWTARAANVTTLSTSNGWQIFKDQNEVPHQAYLAVGPNPLTSVETQPSTPYASTSASGAYVATAKAKATCTWSLSDGNVPGGIDTFVFKLGFGRYQMGFTPAIAKDATSVLTLIPTISWSRAVI